MKPAFSLALNGTISPKRLICWLLGGVMALGALLGCGGAGGSTHQPASQIKMAGAALTLDVLSATDDQRNPTKLHSPHAPHVTIICLRADEAKIKAEVLRFVKDVTPYLHEMISDSMTTHMGSPGPMAFVKATYSTNLFEVGIKAYEPEPASKSALVALNGKLSDFVDGTYIPKNSNGHTGLDRYDLHVEATTKPGRGDYTPHITVTAPSTYASSAVPVQNVSAAIKQTLTIRYYSY